jgi:hypothetical protein
MHLGTINAVAVRPASSVQASLGRNIKVLHGVLATLINLENSIGFCLLFSIAKLRFLDGIHVNLKNFLVDRVHS